MYRGDGSYKSDTHEIQISLIELLRKEKENVDALNESYRAYDTALQTSVELSKYQKMVNENTNRLQNTREEIANYIKYKIGIKLDEDVDEVDNEVLSDKDLSEILYNLK